MCREEGDAIESEGLQASRASRQVKDPDHHAAQAEVHWTTVHDDPVMTLFNEPGDGSSVTPNRWFSSV